MIFNVLLVCEYFLIATGVEARAAEPQPTAASDNESDWLMDSDEASDYADLPEGRWSWASIRVTMLLHRFGNDRAMETEISMRIE